MPMKDYPEAATQSISYDDECTIANPTFTDDSCCNLKIQ